MRAVSKEVMVPVGLVADVRLIPWKDPAPVNVPDVSPAVAGKVGGGAGWWGRLGGASVWAFSQGACRVQGGREPACSHAR